MTAGKPTLDDLLRHYRAYGLDNSATGYRGKEERYGSYRKLRDDALVKTGRSFLNLENYVALIEAIGYAPWAEDARKDWEQSRREWADDRAFYDTYWGTD